MAKKQLLIHLLLFLGILMNSPVIAQDQKKVDALQLEENWAYQDALNLHLELENEGKGDFENKVLIAIIYYKNRDFNNALIWFEKAIQLNDLSKESKLMYADCLRSAGKWSQAEQVYLQFPEYPLAKTFTSKSIAAIDSAAYTVENVRSINSVNDEMAAVFYKDGIVYVSNGNGDKKKNYSWNGRPWLQPLLLAGKPKQSSKLKPTPFPATFSSKLHIGPIAFAKSDNLMFVTQNLPSNAKKSGSGTIRLGLYYATREGGKWGVLKPFKYNSDAYSVAHAALSADGKVLYFVSDMPGGLGGTDIYYCKFEGNTWTNPVNAGSVINTSRNEMFPFLHSEGTLYFSSEGHTGLGGMDIFSATQDSMGNWSVPKNLGPPVNSGFDDFSWVLSKKNDKAYFTSNRPGGKGADDIYEAVFDESFKPVEVCKNVVKGKVIDKISGIPLKNASVYLGSFDKISTDESGSFSIEMECADYNDIVKVTAPGYFPAKSEVQLNPNTKLLEISLLLEKVEVNKPIQINKIYYDLDKSDIREDAAKELDLLVSLLEENPSWIIELGSHTDSRADVNYNLKLSDSRAKAAVEYIVLKGIKRERLFAKGYGESKLVNGCKDGVTCAEEQHAQNRRTEFKLVGFDKFIYQEEGQTVEAQKVIFDPAYQKATSKVIYKIQIGVFTNPEPAFLQKFNDLGNVKAILVQGSAASKYYLESYSNYATAQGYLQQVKARGITDAFIVPFYKGKPITIEQAKKLE